MYIGGEWLGQAFYGQGLKKVQGVDYDGNPTTVTVTKPLPAVSRLLKGVLGTGGLAAGFTGISVGLSHMFHGR